ncbi:hypothetical protein O3M35_001341 [Rhynocoris fuscipes]|uniref:Uncharacterized protein n=1 Tax=Rhynocoris fuscipes TaxID=488301 RepID=A0AAW1DQT7_9HEMI
MSNVLEIMMRQRLNRSHLVHLNLYKSMGQLCFNKYKNNLRNDIAFFCVLPPTISLFTVIKNNHI